MAPIAPHPPVASVPPDGPAAEPPRSGPLGRRAILFGLAIGVPASAVFLYLAVRGLDPGAVRDALTSASLAWVMVAVVGMALVYVIQAERWRAVASHEGSAPRRTFLAMVVGGVALNNIVPGRPGEVVRAYWLKRVIVIPFSRSFATVIVDRGADVVALLVLLVATLPLVEHPRWLTGIVVGAAILGAAIVAAVVGCWAYATKTAAGRARGVPGAVRRSSVRRRVSGLVRGIAGVVNGRALVVVPLLSLLAWITWAGGAWAVAESLGIGLDVHEVVFVTAAVNLGVAIPSSPGFVGTYQWLCVSALGLLGVGQDEAFAFSVLLHASWFVPTTIAGLVIAVSTGTAWRSVRNVEAR